MDSLFWIQQQLRRFDSTCSAAEQRINSARTLQEVVHATQVSTPPEIRALKNSSQAHRKMLATAERKLDALVSQQLEAMEKGTLDIAETLFARCMARDWQILRGHFGRVLQQAEMKARKILCQKRST